MSALAERKSAARAAAFERRRIAHEAAPGAAEQAARLMRVLEAHRGQPLAGYMPMRTEIDPLPAMGAAAAQGEVCVPVIVARATPLRFRAWTPDCPLVEGPFGARVPEGGAWIEPRVLIVPLVAFTRAGGRLGYGGGFYDRTLQGLRARGPVTAIGYAFAAQEDPDLPLDPLDQPLDLIVTEAEVIEPGQ